jgi:signal transduction histidine kinase
MDSFFSKILQLDESIFIISIFSIVLLSAIIAIIESHRADKYKKLYKENKVRNKTILKQKDIFQDELRTFANLMDQINFPIWQRDNRGNVIYCNSSFCEVVGEIRENIINNSEFDLLKDSKEIAGKAIKTGKTQVVEKNVIINGKNTLNQLIEIPITSSFNNATSRIGTVGFALNFIELQNTRERLKHNVELQTRLMETLTNAVAIFGPSRRLEYYNLAYVDLWKFDEDWLKTSPTYDEVLEVLREKRKLPEQADFKSFKQSNVEMFTNLIEKKEDYLYLTNGTVLKVVVIPYQQRGLLFYYEDMTNNLNLERSYNTLLSVQKQTLDNLNEAVSVFGEDKRVKLFNPAYTDIWWLSDSFLHSDPHIEKIMNKIKYLFEKEDWDKFKETFLKSLDIRDSSQLKVNRKDGVILIINFMPLPDGGTLVTYFDVTDKENLERSLRAEKMAYEEADRVKTNFLNNVSYELRSPLTSIMGFTEILLMSDLFDPENQQKESNKEFKERSYLDAIFKSSMKLKYLIDNVIDVSSMDAGYIALEIKAYHIDNLIEDLMPKLNDMLDRREVKLNLYISGQDIFVELDRERIEQVISTIISNAVAMSKIASKIDFTISRIRDNVRFEIEDFGTGIKKEDLPLIFDQFFKIQEDSEYGTGLGLYLSKRIIELHGGFIVAESEEGVGTKFIFEIPLKHEVQIEKNEVN